MMKKFRRILSLALAVLLVIGLMPAAFAAGEEAAAVNLIPTQAAASTANYVCTWNIQDWVAWHEGNGNNSTKRDVVDPDHIFGNEDKGITGWADLLYKQARGDLIFLLDDGWDLPYGTTNKNSPYFGSMVLPTDKFPADEWGATPAERLKTLNDKMQEKGWAGTGLWICAQESSAYAEYYFNGDQEAYWKERMQWCKEAGISYWKIDWGSHMKDITWQRNMAKWAEEVYPELIMENAYGDTGGKTKQDNKRLQESYLQNAVEYASFSDVYRTYDVLDNLMTPLTLDRVGEQLYRGYTEEGIAMGLMNAEDEMYIAASLGLTFGVMRFDPDLAKDVKNSGDAYFGKGTEANHYFAGGKRFVDTRATRNSLDEVTRAVMWERIAPPYAMGDYDVQLTNTYMSDSWQFSSSEKSWEGDTGLVTARAPAAIARGIDLPTVTTSDGADIPYLTASRNPNGAISIATHARTYAQEGYTCIKTADVKLNAGDLTGKIGVFGYYGSLTMTFNQDLTGKRVLAQDLMATEAEDITDQVTIDGNTITIEGSLLAEIGLSAATEGDSSQPGLVIQIGEESDFVAAAETNERLAAWDVNNASFEKFHYDASSGYNQTMKSVTGVDWDRSGTTAASYITEGGRTGDYAAIHTSASAYSVTTYQLNKAIPNGVYKVSAWVKASANANAQLQAVNFGGGTKSVDIAEAADWTQVTIDEVRVINNQIQVQVVSTNAAANSYVIFDDVEVEWVKVLDETKIEADVILEFDFSDYDAAAGTVNGTANGETITATANNVTFITDEDGNEVADFTADGDNTSVGITWTPGESDPMKTLVSGEGVTINFWLKPTQATFDSELFTYGQGANGASLDNALQLLARSGSTLATVLYRGNNGSTGGQKLEGVSTPFAVNEWQLYSFVENGDGSYAVYLNGQQIGAADAKGKTVLGFASDSHADSYWIGCSPILDGGNSHFTGYLDSVTVYNGALIGAQLENLYKEYFAPQTEIVLEVADGELGGQAVMNNGYVGWIGHGADATGDEGTVTFTFDCKQAGDWQMDVYYLSKASSMGMDNNREFDVTVNGDPENVITFRCPEGNSWTDPSLASVYTVETVSLKKGENTLTFGNADDNAPSLVRVVLTSRAVVDANAAAAVEEMIMSKLSIVDNFEQLEAVQECRAAYDALTEGQKALVSEEAYAKLTDAEILMEQWQAIADDNAAAKAVSDKIDAIGEITSVDQEAAVAEARAAYDALTDEQKALVAAETLAKLEAAEAKLEELKAPFVNPFVDVTENDYFYAPTMWAAKNGITTGDSEASVFNPHGDCSRAQVVTFLWRAANQPEPENVENPFADVSENSYYYKAVLWAVQQGITNGTAETTFSPNDPCTRGQVVTFLWRYADQPESTGDNPFTDLTEGMYYIPAVLWAVENGITKGDSAEDVFNPNGACSRAQIVTFLYRYMN